MKRGRENRDSRNPDRSVQGSVGSCDSRSRECRVRVRIRVQVYVYIYIYTFRLASLS